MTESEMIAKVLTIFPEMQIGEDNDGQLIIYTNLRLDADGNLIPFEEDSE